MHIQPNISAYVLKVNPSKPNLTFNDTCWRTPERSPTSATSAATSSTRAAHCVITSSPFTPKSFRTSAPFATRASSCRRCLPSTSSRRTTAQRAVKRWAAPVARHHRARRRTPTPRMKTTTMRINTLKINTMRSPCMAACTAADAASSLQLISQLGLPECINVFFRMYNLPSSALLHHALLFAPIFTQCFYSILLSSHPHLHFSLFKPSPPLSYFTDLFMCFTHRFSATRTSWNHHLTTTTTPSNAV